MEAKKRVLSGIQPTGTIHLGNYFGAIKNWVNMQSIYDCVYCVVDLHAMTVPYIPAELKLRTREMYIDLLSCGIDPEQCTLFVQSYVPEHAELAWILSCITPYGELTRQVQFKDKSDKQEKEGKDQFISTGLLTYPVLQAADILLYRANFVPVGQDQKQHLELTRNIAERFNTRFGSYFELPEHKFTETPKIMSPADPKIKRSRGLAKKHSIVMADEETSIPKKINRAVTDSGNEIEGVMSKGVSNLFELLKAHGKTQEFNYFTQEWQNGHIQYGKLKGAVADAVVELTNEFKQKRASFAANETQIEQWINQAGEKARSIAHETIIEVRKLTGLR